MNKDNKPAVRFDTLKVIASAVDNKVSENIKYTEEENTNGDKVETYMR